MSSHPNFGHAESSLAVRSAALRLCNAYRRNKQQCALEESVITEFENDYLESFFVNFCIFCATTPIPCGFTADLKPDQPSNKRCIKVTTLTKYIGQVKEYLRCRFPLHPDFPKGGSGKEDPTWYKPMMDEFVRLATRFYLKMKGNEDIVFGDTRCQPIYRENRRVPFDVETGEDIYWFEVDEEDVTDGTPDYTDYISQVDMMYLMKTLMKGGNMLNSKSYQQRCWLLILFLACGRGGEVKFIDYSEWQWHPFLQALDIGWTELKCLEKYAMPMVCDKDSFLLDFFHALACFFSVEKGLYRHVSTRDSGTSNYLFPDLHCVTNSKVTSLITDIIRKCLPKGCPPDVTSLFSAKSTRRGAVTQMAVHPQCGIFETSARSGHSTGVAVDYYNDRTNVECGLPGGMALCGYRDVRSHEPPFAPRVDCLGMHNKAAVKRLMDACFIVDVDYFKIGRPLRPVLRICFASLLMYHQDVTMKLGMDNAVCSFLRKAAREVCLQDKQFPHLTSDQVLWKWSSIIQEDFRVRNSIAADATAEISSIATTLNHHSTAIQKIAEALNGLKRSIEESDAKNECHFCTLQAFYEKENASLRQEVGHLRGKVSLIRTPPKQPSNDDAPLSSIPPVSESRSVRRKLSHFPQTPNHLISASHPATSSTLASDPRSTPAPHSLPSPHPFLPSPLLVPPISHITMRARLLLKATPIRSST